MILKKLNQEKILISDMLQKIKITKCGTVELWYSASLWGIFNMEAGERCIIFVLLGLMLAILKNALREAFTSR